jgi:AcrR family transcriptional regulator
MAGSVVEEGTEPGAGRTGRPRDRAIDDAVLAVAVRRLAEDGYARLSIEAVAAEAGVSKPAVYRRYRSKADLATAAVAALAATEPDPDTGSTYADLVAFLQTFQRSYLRPNGPALLGTVLAEEHHTPELLACFRERLVRPRRARLRALLVRGQARGEVRADADLDAAVNAMVGALYARHLTGQGVPRTWPGRTVDLVWPALATPADSTDLTDPAPPRTGGPEREATS